MNLDKLPHWLQAALTVTGGLGLFLVGFLDSSVLTFPVVNDLLVIDLSIRNPARMPFYALMAALGSVTGCLVLYFIARKGGEALYRRRAGARAARIRAWTKRHGFLSILIPAMLPPPMPFKIFVFAAGAWQMPLRSFVLAVVISRSFRFLGEGILAVRYGPPAKHFLLEHKLETTVISLLIILAIYLAVRLASRRAAPQV